jgi:hypothetical protein
MRTGMLSFPIENIPIKFSRLKYEWQKDTMFMSSITDIAMHPAYQQIKGQASSDDSKILRRSFLIWLREPPGAMAYAPGDFWQCLSLPLF